MNPTEWIPYYRVSTKKQDMGLEAQEDAVTAFIAQRGGVNKLPPFIEKESGRNDNRPQLLAAIEQCRKTGATLAIAKLDRLSRDLHFITGLQKAGVPFVCADTPEMDEFTVHIFAAVAQREAKLIRERTKAGMAVAKRRGAKIGMAGWTSDTDPAAVRELALKVRRAAAENHTKSVRLYIAQAQKAGCTTLVEIAEALTNRGIKTARGGTYWLPTQVARIMKRGA